MASRGAMLFLTFSLLCLNYCFTNTLLIPYGQRLDDEVVLTPLKRPFCNAFTGCGRKRSDLAPVMSSREMFTQRQFADKDNAAFDSDNVIELTRKIMTGAKLWEALREASAELSRRKQKSYY